MSKRIAMFNHKGGVSKTTSVYNIGWMLAKSAKVLIVDADPQCNLSALILGDNFEPYYIEPRTEHENIKDGVKVAFEGKPSPISAVNCYSPQRAPSLFLLAGHANLSEYDAALTFAQTSNNAIATLQNLPGAFSELLRLTEDKYSIDYTMIDMNPSLSAINQNLFISSHAFIVPTNPDPFSVMAIDTLTSLLPRWNAWVKSAAPLFSGSAYPLPDFSPKFIGSLIQRFNIRKGKAARPYRDNIAEIKASITGPFVQSLSKAGMVLPAASYPTEVVDNDYCLGEIPDFQGLLPKAYDAGVPVFELTDGEINETGPVLAQMVEKRKLFFDQFQSIAATVVTTVQNV
ncbi:MAG: AAA family ATPase [Nitrososphaerota archaeon]|nr:AAA family ATPase [Nitrososphaerota archaeon]